MSTTIGARLLHATAAFVFLTAPAIAASASGTAFVQQSDGTTKTYSNVHIAIGNDSMALTTADGVGTLVIGKAACSREGELVMCLPYDATLFQNGLKRHVLLKSGTVYINPTTTPQTLAHSSAQIPPHGVMLTAESKAGTIVTLSGTVDEVNK